MFTFGKNAPEKPTFSKNTLILDYLVRMEKDLDSYRAMCIFIHKLQSQKMRTMQRQELIETFENVIKKSGGEIFGLPNDDMVIIFNNKAHDEILACLVKVRFMFHDDPLIQNAFDLENAGFVKFFELGNGAAAFKSLIKANMENSDEPGRREGNAAMRGTAAPVPSFMGGARKLRRELTPAMLSLIHI